MNFTREQQNALDAKGNVLVSAAAGSGKTAVLVERVANMLIDEESPVDADALLVVTFTNAAAAEMKTRISKRISEEIRKNPNNLRLKKQKLLLTKAAICTIDSLCISLARDYFYKLNLPPDFKIADNAQISKIKEKCLDEIIAENFEKDEEDFLKLADLMGGENADERIKKEIEKINEYLCSLPFPELFIEKNSSLYNEFDKNSVWLHIVFGNALDQVKEKRNAMVLALDELQNDELYSAYGSAFEETIGALNNLESVLEAKDWDNTYKKLSYFAPSKLKALRGYSDIEFRDRMKTVKGDADLIFKELKKVFNCEFSQVENDIKLLTPIVDLLLKMTLEFNKKFFEEKIANNCLSFADVEIATLKLLAQYDNGEIKYTAIAKELSNKYDSVLVDEYQDTNDLQNTIFKALSNDGQKLFMVGDVKQSIYGFRKANPKNFLKYRNEMPDYEEGLTKSKVIMSGNFRSSIGVCDFVNYVFRNIMSQKCGQMNYEAEDELVPMAKFCDLEEPRVDVNITVNDEENLTDAQAEAYNVASKIKDMINGEPIVTENGNLRKPEYRDFCVLFRKRVTLQKFAEIFKNLNIPCWADESGGLFISKEVTNIISLLRVIDNPYNDVPLLALMMNDIYMFSADEIAIIRTQNRKNCIYSALKSQKEKSKKLIDFLNEIELFRKYCVTAPVSKLITKIYNITGYQNTVYAYDNGEQANANLILFKNIAKDYEESTGRGLSAFLRYVNKQIEQNKVGNASLVTENDNVVKLMTMHRSKGLQFPICFVAGLQNQFNFDDNKQNLILNEKCGVGMNILDRQRKLKYSTLPRDAAIIDNKVVLISEEMRLLYVAMTRAKDKLIMSGCVDNKEKYIDSIRSKLNFDNEGRIDYRFILHSNNYLKWIVACAITHPLISDRLCDLVSADSDVKETINVTFDKVKNVSCEDEVVLKMPEYNNEILEKIRQALEYEYPYKVVNSVSAKQSASAIAHKEVNDNFAFTAVPLFLQKQKFTAAQKGTIMHSFMQLCDFKAARENIESEINRLISEELMSEKEAKVLDKESIKAFLDSDLCKRIIDSPLVEKEKAFMVELDAKDVDESLTNEFDNEKIVIQGFVDLCFVENDKIVVIDYKTDRVEESSELVERYKMQLIIYKKALEQVYEMKVSETDLYSFYLKQAITV